MNYFIHFLRVDYERHFLTKGGKENLSFTHAHYSVPETAHKGLDRSFKTRI